MHQSSIFHSLVRRIAWILIFIGVLIQLIYGGYKILESFVLDFSITSSSAAVTPQVSAGNHHTVGLHSYGTVVAVGWNGDGQCDVSGWSGITQVSGGGFYTVGLKSDGTVVAVGDNTYGQRNVSGWNIIRRIFSGTVKQEGAGLKDVVISGLPTNPVTNESGYYVAYADSGWSGTATPTHSSYTFTPPFRNYSGVTSHQFDQDYIANIIIVPVIAVTSPNGGESWQVGSSHNITWTTSGIVGNVKIEYSTNSGGSWSIIGGSTPNDGTHPWTVPNAPSTTCLVRISEAADGNPNDTSNSMFSIISETKNDFNGDGQEDILWRNYSTGQNALWYLSSNGATAGLSQENLETMSIDQGFKPAQLYQNVWEAGEILYKDERVYHDVMEVDVSQEKIIEKDAREAGDVLIMSGEAGKGGDAQDLMKPGNQNVGVQAISVIGSTYLTTITDVNWQIGGTGDFNGDGNIDILWRHYGTGQNALWYMNGSTIIGTAYLITITDLNWQIGGTGDFNGDGSIDILWRHYGTGQNALWYMNGSTIIGSTYLTTITDVNWRIENH